MVDVTDTAQPIAWVRAEESALPAQQRLFEDPYARLFAGAGGASEVAQRMASVPFFRESVRLRTRYLDDAVRTALGNGLRQIVLLGAGFDCRGLRMHEISRAGAAVYEVDLPPQLAAKTAVLSAAGVVLPAHVRHVPCDLATEGFAERLATALAAAGFDTGAGALFLWEGVVGYLSDAAIDETLRAIVHSGRPRAWLALTYAVNRFGPNDLHRRLDAAGLALVEDIDLVQLYQRHLPGEPPPGGEFFRLALARTGT